jgi:hypothetical protein
MLRKDLEPEVLYFEYETAQYFYTPDCVGVIWLTPEEVGAEFGWDTKAIFIDSLEVI